MSIMQLIVSGLPPLTNPNHFHALFGRYVYGYKPWTHCDNCFVKRQETQINPKMGNGSFHLKDDLFYLCGVGRSLSESVHPEFPARARMSISLSCPGRAALRRSAPSTERRLSLKMLRPSQLGPRLENFPSCARLPNLSAPSTPDARCSTLLIKCSTWTRSAYSKGLRFIDSGKNGSLSQESERISPAA
jgi:hypothetical protein